MAKSGWIKLHRQIMDSEFYTEPRRFSKYEAWVDLLLRANHEEEDGIQAGSFLTSYGELAKSWGWSKSTTWRFLEYLLCQNMIAFERNENGTDRRTVVTIVKWDLYQGKKNAKRNENGTISEFLPIVEEEKNILVENNSTKKKTKTFEEDSLEMTISKYIFAKIKEITPTFKEPNFQTWCKHVDAILRLDKRNNVELREVIDWVYADGFWKTVILSPGKLRDKYDQVNIKRLQEKENARPKYEHEQPRFYDDID